MDSFRDIDTLIEYIRSYGATLVAVTKNRTVSEVRTLYDRGIRDFGENRVSEMVDKAPHLPDDVRWHMIGHLQTNKIKKIRSFVHLVQSVDRPRLWAELHRHAERVGRSIPALLEIKIAQEPTKTGFAPFDEGLEQLLDQGYPEQYHRVEVQGVMGMASFTDDWAQVRREFRTLRRYFEYLKQHYFTGPQFHTVSMGMSRDFHIALEEGATMVRLGRILFTLQNL